MISAQSALLFGLVLLLLTPSGLASPDSCIGGINTLLANITTLIFQNQTAMILQLPFIAYTGKGLNNLGDYELCRNTPNTSYIALGVQTKGSSTWSVLGVCGPANCTAADYLNKTVQDTIQSVLALMTPVIGVNISSLLANVSITPADPNSYPAVTASSWVGFFVVGIPIFLALIASSIKFFEDQKAKAKSATENGNRNFGVNPGDTSLPRVGDSYVALEEGETKTKKKNLGYKLLECWAIQDTFKQLFYPEVNPKHDTNLHIFNGIRFLSILWVLLGHEYLFRVNMVSNYNDLPLIVADKFMNVVGSGVFAVDTFFFLSGFFAAFVLYSKLKAMKVGVATYGSVLLHRIIRILPVYAFVIMFYWKVSVYFGNGPVWGVFVTGANGCDDSWWKNMFFIDSWFDDENCIGWGWYLSCDMQMFLISPIIVWLYLKKVNVGLISIALLTIASLSIGMYYSFADNVYAGPLALGQSEGWMKDIYKNPLVRVPPYLVGTALALIYRSTKEAKSQAAFEKIKNSKLASWVVELSGVALISLLVWLPAQVQNNPSNWSPWFHHVFMALNRFLFSIGLLLIVLPTLAGSKTVIRWILSAGFWAPLATLTFAIYLIHLVVLFAFLYSEKSTFFFSNANTLWEMIPLTFVSVFGALIIYTVVEAPVGKLEGAIRANSTKPAKSVKPEINNMNTSSSKSEDESKIIIGNKNT